jgi:hypothetical protein
MKQALEQQYTVKYGPDKVVILLKDVAVDEATLDQVCKLLRLVASDAFLFELFIYFVFVLS